MKKRIPSQDEILNDPSLRWCPYRKWELVWSDKHQANVRFLEYAKDGRIRVASVDAIAPLRGFVTFDQIRRHSFNSETR